MERLLLSSLAGLALMSAVPARAGEIEMGGHCLHQRTPKVHMDAIRQRYFSNDLVAQIEVMVPLIEGMVAAIKACDLETSAAAHSEESRKTLVGSMGLMWAGHVMDDLGAERLESKFGVSRSRLDEIWAGLPAEEQDRLADYVQTVILERRPWTSEDHLKFIELVLAVNPKSTVHDLVLDRLPDGTVAVNYESQGFAVIAHFLGRAYRARAAEGGVELDSAPPLAPKPAPLPTPA